VLLLWIRIDWRVFATVGVVSTAITKCPAEFTYARLPFTAVDASTYWTAPLVALSGPVSQFQLLKKSFPLYRACFLISGRCCEMKDGAHI
jgi:hypothetical protein